MFPVTGPSVMLRAVTTVRVDVKNTLSFRNNAGRRQDDPIGSCQRRAVQWAERDASPRQRPWGQVNFVDNFVALNQLTSGRNFTSESESCRAVSITNTIRAVLPEP